MAFYYSRESYRNIVRGSTLTGSGVISTVNVGVTAENDDDIDRGISGPLTGLTPPSILSFYAIPTQVSWGDPVSIFWNTLNTDKVFLNLDIGDVSKYGVSSGRYDIPRLLQPSTFELTAVNGSGSVNKFTTVGMRTVAPAFNYFFADPNPVPFAGGVTLSWSITENPTSISISGIGDVTQFGASGQYRVTSITQSTIFAATATNAFGSASRTTSVSVGTPNQGSSPEILSFFGDPQNTSGTGRTTLRWFIRNNPSSITITDIGDVNATSTQFPVNGLTDNKNYTLTASNTFGSASASTTIIFGSAQSGNPGVTFATDFPGTNSLVSVEDMKNNIRNNAYIQYNFDGSVSTVTTGSRANGFYGDDPSFTWFRFVNGNYKGNSGQQIVDAAGNTIDPFDTLSNTSVKEWYKWGARSFSINLPFGKVAATFGTQKEALAYQPDSYVNARDGLNINGVTCNEPMPWLVGDFVKTWKALISGTQGTLTNNEWDILTGNTGWFNPNDPIKVKFYNGGINFENYVRWKTYSRQQIIDRLIDSFTPYLETGGEIAVDALTVSPGPVVGQNVCQAQHEFYVNLGISNQSPFSGHYGDGTTLGITLDAAWWDFYSNWLVPNFGLSKIYCEGVQQKFKIGNTWHDSPYLGVNFINDDESYYQNFGNQPGNDSTVNPFPAKQHTPDELGNVRGIMGFFQSIRKLPIVGASGSSGFTFDRYWYLRDYAAPAYFYDNNGNTFPEMDGNARVYRAVESTGYGSGVWMYSWLSDKLLNKNRIKYEDPKLDQTINSAYFLWDNIFNPSNENQGEDGAWTNIGGVEDFKSRFPTIDDYAHYLAFLKSGGTPIPRGFSTGYRHPSTVVDPNKIIDHTKLLSFGLKNTRIENTIWIYLDELDAYTRGKLNGTSSGQFYTPSITADVEQKRIKDYFDYRLERAKETLGYYPKYFVFSLTKNDGSTQPSQFQMERYLYTPATYPNSSDYTQYTSGTTSPCYDDSIPTVIDLDQSVDPESLDKLISTGYSVNDQNYKHTVNLINKLLTTARQWKTERGYSEIKFGVEGTPEVTLEPRTSYTITGGGTGVTLERFNSWDSSVWTRPQENGNSVTLGSQQTTQSKDKVVLEFAKRIEPILPNLDVLYPSVYDYYTNTDSQDDRYKSYQDTKLDLSRTLKAAPYSFSGDIVPLVSYSHVGDIEGGTVGNLDPITLSGGTTYDDAQVYSDIVDWVRDDHGDVVQGYSFWNDTSYASSAIGISSYVGITADRDRVLKWIKSFDGAGATINWGNSLDVETNIKRFYDVHSELLKRYAHRFGEEDDTQPPQTGQRLKVLMQGLYHPTNGNGIVQNVFDTGVSYSNLDVVTGKILYVGNHLGFGPPPFDWVDLTVVGASAVPNYTNNEYVFAHGATPGSATDVAVVKNWSLPDKKLTLSLVRGGFTSGNLTGWSSNASYQIGVTSYAKINGKYIFYTGWGNQSGLGLKEPFTNDIPGNTLTGAGVNQIGFLGTTSEWKDAATELLRLRFVNLDKTFSGDICKWRADDCPPLGNERTSYTGYILPDPEWVRYPSIGKFQTPSEEFHVETCRYLNKIVYDATKQCWPSAKVGFWGECQADSEPFNNYNVRWDDFVQDPNQANNGGWVGSPFVDDTGTPLTVTGLTGYVNYVAKKLKYIYEDACDFVVPNFYSPYNGLSSDGPDDADIHYSQISSLWNSATGHKIVNSRTKTAADVTLKLIRKMNELLPTGKKKEVYPTVWNFGLVSNQFGLITPSEPSGDGILCGGRIYGLTADRADSFYSLRKFMEQNLGVSGSTYTFWNLGHFSQSDPCDSLNLTRRRHPELVKLDRDQYYDRYIKQSIEWGVDGFYQWNVTTAYDYRYGARSKNELTGVGSNSINLLNIGDVLNDKSEVAVDVIYQRRFLLSEVLGLSMAGITYGAYFENPNYFPGATVAGFSFDTWGQYNNIGHPASKFARHKVSDYILRHYCQYWANRAISEGIL